MNKLYPLFTKARIGAVLIAYVSSASFLMAVAPTPVDDDLTSTPFSQDVVTAIDESTLISNDSGDDKAITGVVGSTSSKGAAISWTGGSTDEVSYDPTSVAAFLALDDGEDTTDSFAYTLDGSDGSPANATVTVQVDGVNDAPTLTGISTTGAVNDNATSTPFTGADIDDVDVENVTVTVTVGGSPDPEGVMTNLDGFSDDTGGVYSYTGSTTNAQSKLRALVFDPTENRIAPGATDTTAITVVVSDGDDSSATRTHTVTVTSINDNPTLADLGAKVDIGDNATTTPFSSGTIVDPDFGASITVTVTIAPAVGGTFTTLGGFSESPAGTFTYTGNPTNATTALTSLVFDPTENRLSPTDDEDVTLTVTIDDTFVSTPPSDTKTVNVTSINDDPVLDPLGPFGTFALPAGTTIKPYISINSLTDIDFEDLTPPVNVDDPPAGDDFTATITITPSPYGNIISDSFSGSGGTYTFTAKRAQVETAIKNVVYQAPSANSAFTLSLTVADSHTGNSNAVEALVNVTQADPGLTGLVPSGQQVADDSVIFPFATALFNGFGDGTRRVEVTVDNDVKGEFQNLGSEFTKIGASAPFIYRMTGSSEDATTAIRNLRFHPTPNRITGASETVTMTITVKDSAGTSTLFTGTPVVVTVFPTNDAPIINSTSPIVRINDDAIDTTPLASISITDLDAGGTQPIILDITLIGANPDTNAPVAGGGIFFEPIASGLLTTSGSYPNVTYTLAGSPSAVTAAMQALVFLPGDPPPAPERLALGKVENVTITLSVADYFTAGTPPTDPAGGTDVDANTQVIVTYVNGAPFINGVPPLSQQPFPVAGSADSMGTVSAEPFKNLTVSDDDTTITFVITLDDENKGVLINLGGFSDDGSGVYSMTDTPANIQADLQALVFEVSDSFTFPVNTPGLTKFTLSATDPAPASNNRTLDFEIFVREQNLSHIVTVATDSASGAPLIAGSLREALSFAGVNDSIVFEFPPEDFPVTIHLERPLFIDKSVSIVGSAPNQLTISGDTDNDGVGDTQLFIVQSDVEFNIERVTLEYGVAAAYGGAITADTGSRVIARNCSFENNSAGQFGGAIDIFEGELLVEGCLFINNGVFGSIAKGGGAISVFTSTDSVIRNSTFFGNVQDNAGGDGGGSIYAQNSLISGTFYLTVDHCTFAGNVDEKLSGSAIMSSSAGTFVQVRNNIFSDDGGLSGKVLDVLGSGKIKSLGGNIATDSTVTTYTQGGSSENVVLLNDTIDTISEPSANIGLLPLAYNGGLTQTMALDVGSSAIDAGLVVAPTVVLDDEDSVWLELTGIDQRGVWRDTPDIGAFENGIFKRVTINEIYLQGTTGTDFIEFYNPRDSETLDMVGLELRVDGALMHTFTTQSLIPGAGFAWTATFDLEEEKGNLELWNSEGQVLLTVDYIGGFSEAGTELDITGQSITRYPNFAGGLLPHQRIVTLVTGIGGGSLTSPGFDVTGAPLNGGNAPPIAVVDTDEDGFAQYSILATETLTPDLLDNDIEFDRTDTLKFTEIMSVSMGGVINQELLLIDTVGAITLVDVPTADGVETTLDDMGIDVTIDVDQLGITYDPTGSDEVIGLAKDQVKYDIWAYTMRDYYYDGGTMMDVAHSRGADAMKQKLNIEKATSYFTVQITGVNENPEATDDTASTTENRALRLLGDTDLLDPANFSFGDLNANFMEFDENGVAGVFLPNKPTVAILANDDDVDSDDSSTSLLLVGVHQTSTTGTSTVAFSELGASVTLDIRFDRTETNILYDPRTSPTLNKLSNGESVDDVFYYTIVDQHGAEAVGKVTITVNGVNDAPTATDDYGFSVFEDDTLDIAEVALIENDSDPDQDGNGPDDTLEIDLSTFPTTSAQGANVTFDGTTITYDPAMMKGFEELARNETLDDSFQYTLVDTFGTTRVATVFLTVNGNNDTPVAEDGIQLDITENDTETVLAGVGLLENIGDIEIDINGSPPDDDPWVIPQREVTTPLGAALGINPDGSYSYDANSVAIDALIEGEVVTEDFTYWVTDNSRTRAIDDLYKVEANRTDVTLPVLANDAVVGSTPVAVVSYGEDLGDANVTIIESVDHSLRDGLLVRIVGYAGAAPYNGVFPITSIDADHFSIPVAFDGGDLTTGGTWQPWFNITAVSAADNGGTLTIATDSQSILYTAVSNFFGAETFTYTIEDGAGGQDVATVAVENVLRPLNGTIRANDDIFRVGTDTDPVDVDVLANDNTLPALGSELTITEVTPAGESVEIVNGGKALRYTSGGTVFSYTYTVSGGGTSTAQATVDFEVEDRTDLLTGNDDSFFVVTGSADVLLDVLANDPNLPNFPVTHTLKSVQYAGLGAAEISGDMISYTPPAFPFLSTDTFTYTAEDASGATTTQTVRVDVVADAPDFRAQADNYRVVAGSDPIVLNVLFNDGLIQNNGATIRIEDLGLNTDAPVDPARALVSGGGASILYTPPASPATEDFTYEIEIGGIERREALVTIEVVASFEVDAVANDDEYDVDRDSGPHTLDVLNNDFVYPDAGWGWTITAVTAPDESGVAVNDGGTAITYTPAADFFGTETFTYTIEDVFGDSSTATVTVKVGELIVCPDVFVVMQDSSNNPLQVLANDDLLDRYGNDYKIVLPLSTPDEDGTVSIDGVGPNNQLLYTPKAGFIGEETFTYTVEDSSGNTMTGDVLVIVVDELSDRDDSFLRVEITGINDIPMLSGIADGAITDKETIQPFANVLITDLDEFGLQAQSVSVTFDSTYGTISAPAMTMNGPGSYSITDTPAAVTAALNAIVFTPFENVIDYIEWGLDNSVGDQVFTLSLDDWNLGPVLGDSADAPIVDVVTINIEPINDDPFLVGNLADLFLKVNALPRAVLLTPYFDDVDDEVLGDEIIWTVSDNTNTSLFASTTIDPVSQLLVLTLAEDAFGVADITVRGTDRGGLFVEDTFTVTVDGPPVIELEPGQENPDSPSFDSGSQVGSRRDYTQSFVVTNEGVLPADAFILNISGLETPVDGITLFSAKYSSDENGTPDIFGDDTRSSDGVTILQPVPGTPEYSVKYDQPLAPGESVVVHLTYRASSLSRLTIEPIIEVELTTATPLGLNAAVITMMPDSETGEVGLSFTIEAGKSYIIQSTGTLDGNWDTWALVLPVSQFDRELAIIDDGLFTTPHPLLIPQRFYRIVEVID